MASLNSDSHDEFDDLADTGKSQSTQLLEEPSESTFWQKYSPHLEMPTSAIISVLIHAMILGTLVLVLVVAMSGDDKTPVPIRLVEGGEDESGLGSAGSGGVDEPITRGDSTPNRSDFESLALPTELPQVREDIQKQIQIEDPSATTPLSDEKAASYAALDQAIRDKLLGVGQNKGAGQAGGKGYTGQSGSGPGGIGADSTRARSLRWVLRFRTTSGRDYLDQLHALKAVVIVPIPPENKEAYIYRDLLNPKTGEKASETEWTQLAGQIQFCDFKRTSIEGVKQALNLNFTPSMFWAFFPRELEDELSRLETSYRNRRAEAIEETIFQVTVRSGQYTLVVVDQKVKR